MASQPSPLANASIVSTCNTERRTEREEGSQPLPLIGGRGRGGGGNKSLFLQRNEHGFFYSFFDGGSRAATKEKTN